MERPLFAIELCQHIKVLVIHPDCTDPIIREERFWGLRWVALMEIDNLLSRSMIAYLVKAGGLVSADHGL